MIPFLKVFFYYPFALQCIALRSCQWHINNCIHAWRQCSLRHWFIKAKFFVNICTQHNGKITNIAESQALHRIERLSKAFIKIEYDEYKKSIEPSSMVRGRYTKYLYWKVRLFKNFFIWSFHLISVLLFGIIIEEVFIHSFWLRGMDNSS